jgi:hypothetical protein
VASSEALDLLYRTMHTVLYRRVTMAIKTASKVGVFVDCCLFACCPGGHWGDMEQVVAQCWHSVASRVALDIPHWAMPPSVSLRCTAVAVKTAGRGGAFVRHRCLFYIIIHSFKAMLWSIKTNNKLQYYYFMFIESIHIVLASVGDNGCRFGHHCRRRTNPI